MVLTVNENQIVLDATTSDIKKYQSSQLEFYGFKNIDNLFHKVSREVEQDLLKVIEYFKLEGVEVRCTAAVDMLIQQSISRKENLHKLFFTGERIKRGKLNDAEFKLFRDFLKTLPRKLKGHQVKAAFHLFSIKNGANFSVPGSGKTSVVLSVYEQLKTTGLCNLLFIVGPPSCFQPWKDEFQKTLGRSPDTIVLSGGNKTVRRLEYFKSIDKTAELYLSTFHTVLKDYRDVIKLLNQKGINPFFVIDEAHYIKQIGGSWATSLLKIAEYTKFRCILTGTPIPKSYKDIFNPFDFLWIKDSPLNQSDKLQIEIWEKNGNTDMVKKLLDAKIGPLFYRVRKKDLKLKPAIFHKPILIKMNHYERKIYQFIRSKINELSQKDFIRNDEILAKLWRGRMIRLRQAVSYSRLLATSIENYSENLLQKSELARAIQEYDELEVPGKLKVLTEMVLTLNHNGQKVLIWANFIDTLKLINKHFIKLGLKNELIYGKTPVRKNEKKELIDEKTREEIINEFIQPTSGLDILIANPAACAESISLHTTCFHAIYYDLSYNCAQYLQSLDRIHRVGGSEKTIANYYFLQYKDSIDQDIKTNLDRKSKKMYEVIDKDYEIYDLDMTEDDSDDDIAAYKRLFNKSL